MQLREHDSADLELRAIASALIATVECDPDIALATLFLNQIAGAYPVRHCTETGIVVALIGRAMGKSEPELAIVTAAALTMNVGMVHQAELFQQRDTALSTEERAMVRRHPRDSVELLRWAGVTDEEWLNYVLLHHENDDGSGYPEGRKGDDIARNAKLIGLADRYCAFVSARNYRRSLLPPVALDKLLTDAAMPADPSVLEQFAAQIGSHPPGTLVRLHNGETGVVVNRPKPFEGLRVCALRGADGNAMAQPLERLTTAPHCAIAEVLHEDQARLRFTMQQVWGEFASL
jgi:response regulator RpfG family c-di-GMP phosphodiesterase